MVEHLDPFTDSDRLRVIESTLRAPRSDRYKFRAIRAALDAPDWEIFLRTTKDAWRAEAAEHEAGVGSDA